MVGAQEKVARLFRDWTTEVPAFRPFERQVAGDLRQLLEQRGVAEERIAKQLDLLSVEPQIPVVPPGGGVNTMGSESLEECVPLGFGWSAVGESVRPSPTSPAATPPPHQGETGDVEEKDEGLGETPGSFVFSIRGSCNRRTPTVYRGVLEKTRSPLQGLSAGRVG